MDDEIPIPVTTVSQIAGMLYLDVIKHVTAMGEAMPGFDPWIRYLGDDQGAVRPSVASSIIVSVALERASAGGAGEAAEEVSADAAE